MSKLVDKERLAKLAQALDAKAKAAVKAENERALAAEEALQGAIDAINNAENGILAQAKAHAEEKDAVIQGEVDALEGRMDAVEAKDVEQDGRLDNIEALVLGGEGEDNPLDVIRADVAANKAAIEVLNGDAEEEGSVAKAVKDAVDAEAELRANADNALDERLQAVEGQLAEGGALEARVAQAEADIDALEEAVAAAQAQADKGVADAAAEKLRAEGEEAKIRQELANEKAALQAEIDADVKVVADAFAEEKARVAEKEANFEGRIAANEAFVAAQPDVDKAQDDRLDAIEEDIARLDGAVDVEGSVKKQIKDAIDEVNGAAANLEERVAANEAFVAGYQAKEDKVREDFAQADADNLQAAKDYADQQITALVDSAPDAMNTLNELAKAINDNQDVYDAYVEEHAQAMANMKAELQKEIDDDVAAEALLRDNADKALQQNIDAKVAQADYDVKVKALEDEDARIAGLVQAEEDRAKEVEEDHESRIAANEAFVAAHDHKPMEDRLDALEAKFEGDASVEQQIADALQDAKDYADEKDAVVQGEVDALEAVVGKEAEGENAATGIFAKLAEMQADIDQNEADCDQAIADEVEARNQAISDALEAYSTTEEMKVMLGNVVNSLALTMENDKVVLKLGGVDGIAITEVSLDLATDADIEEIINGLDAQE